MNKIIAMLMSLLMTVLSFFGLQPKTDAIVPTYYDGDDLVSVIVELEPAPLLEGITTAAQREKLIETIVPELSVILEENFLKDDEGRWYIPDLTKSGDIAKLPDIVELAKRYGARVMVDDAHGFGVIGKGGRGTASYFGLEKDVDLTMGTFSKSLASLGGFVAGEAKVIDYIRCNSRPYIFAASVPPASIAVANASLDYLKAHPELPQTLGEISRYMRQKLLTKGIKIIMSETPIIPIYTYDPIPTLQIQKELYERGV